MIQCQFSFKTSFFHVLLLLFSCLFTFCLVLQVTSLTWQFCFYLKITTYVAINSWLATQPLLSSRQVIFYWTFSVKLDAMRRMMKIYKIDLNAQKVEIKPQKPNRKLLLIDFNNINAKKRNNVGKTDSVRGSLIY